MDIVLVGTGNVAMIIGQLLVSAGHRVTDVHGRNEAALVQIANLLNAKTNTNFSKLIGKADVCIIAVSDAAIASVANQIEDSNVLMVHTSGATSKDVLSKFRKHGVLYPLQSLRKELDRLPDVPFFIDANTSDDLEKLETLAASMSRQVRVCGDEERLKFHVAAVFCSNFTNYLYALTDRFCKEENIEFSYLLPLITETAERLAAKPAARLQTGPAIRRDLDTIRRHEVLLQSHPEAKLLYDYLTHSIQSFYSHTADSEE